MVYVEESLLLITPFLRIVTKVFCLKRAGLFWPLLPFFYSLRILYSVFRSYSPLLQLLSDLPLSQPAQLCVLPHPLPHHQIQFVLPIYFWMCGLPQQCDRFTKGKTHKENWLLSSNSYQLPIAPLPKVGLHAHLPSPCRAFV